MFVYLFAGSDLSFPFKTTTTRKTHDWGKCFGLLVSSYDSELQVNLDEEQNHMYLGIAILI